MQNCCSTSMLNFPYIFIVIFAGCRYRPFRPPSIGYAPSWHRKRLHGILQVHHIDITQVFCKHHECFYKHQECLYANDEYAFIDVTYVFTQTSSMSLHKHRVGFYGDCECIMRTPRMPCTATQTPDNSAKLTFLCFSHKLYREKPQKKHTKTMDYVV